MSSSSMSSASSESKSQIEEAFVTFSDRNYLDLLEVAIASVHEFSTRPIIAYGINVDIPFSTTKYPRLIKRRIDDEKMGKTPMIYFQKLNIILKSGVTRGVYVESDDVVNYQVDDLFKLCSTIDKYPLCPIHPSDPNNQESVMKLAGAARKTNSYVHGHVIFSKTCLPFIQECFDFGLKYKENIGANWDETVLNVIMWKYEISKWHAPIYDPWFEYIDNYVTGKPINDPNMHGVVYHFFHGCKNATRAWRMLETLKVNKNKSISAAETTLCKEICPKIVPGKLKIDRAIVASDSNPMYLQFWKVIAPLWTKMGIRPTLAYIGDEKDLVDEKIGDVIRFKPISGVSTAMYSQVIRLLLPIYYENEVSLISDIDMIPINVKYYQNSIKNIPDDKFVIYRNLAYSRELHQYPMCYNAGKGYVFKDLFKISSTEQIPTLVKYWNTLRFGWSTDEMVLYNEIDRFDQNKVVKLGHGVNGRIDRSTNCVYNLNTLNSGEYIDCHSVRPYDRYRELIDKLVSDIENFIIRNAPTHRNNEILIV